MHHTPTLRCILLIVSFPPPLPWTPPSPPRMHSPHARPHSHSRFPFAHLPARTHRPSCPAPPRPSPAPLPPATARRAPSHPRHSSGAKASAHPGPSKRMGVRLRGKGKPSLTALCSTSHFRLVALTNLISVLGFCVPACFSLPGDAAHTSVVFGMKDVCSVEVVSFAANAPDAELGGRLCSVWIISLTSAVVLRGRKDGIDEHYWLAYT